MLDLVIGAIIQESDCRTGTAACADSTAVCGQLTDTLLQVNGNKVAQQYCTQQFFLRLQPMHVHKQQQEQKR